MLSYDIDCRSMCTNLRVVEQSYDGHEDVRLRNDENITQKLCNGFECQASVLTSLIVQVNHFTMSTCKYSFLPLLLKWMSSAKASSYTVLSLWYCYLEIMLECYEKILLNKSSLSSYEFYASDIITRMNYDCFVSKECKWFICERYIYINQWVTICV
jgi:hypothetical protein